MANAFEKMGGIAGSVRHLLIIVWPAGCVMAVISIMLMIEDYDTSRLGYLALPTLKVNTTWVPVVVAMLPQVAQVVLFYIFGLNTKKGWALLIAVVFFGFDIVTDVWYKCGQNWGLVPLAFVESLLLFTLGSEVLFTISVGFVTETFGEFIIALSVFLSSIIQGIGVALDALGLRASKEEDRRR